MLCLREYIHYTMSFAVKVQLKDRLYKLPAHVRDLEQVDFEMAKRF